MDLDPILKALAAALAGEGAAVQLHPAGSRGQLPDLELLPEAHSAFDGDSDIAVVVSTSGSTGAPKQTLLSVDALAASSVGTAMALGGEGQWLLALPAHYVAGVQVLVRSLFAGTRPWLMDQSAGFTAEAFTAAALELTDRTRFTSLVPTQLQRLLQDPAAETLAVLRRFNAILLGGSPANAGLLSAARAAGINVVTTYGMSETCGGCVYDGVPLEGVRVDIREGRIWLGGELLASGYLAAPALTAHNFIEESTGGENLRWYRTDDEGELAADGRLTVLGRMDDVIITGGLKVSARVVAEQLLLVPGVQDAFVTGVPDPDWGQRVCAAVVGSCSMEALLAGAGAVLESHAVPKTVRFVAEVPMLPTGKPDRQGLKAMLAAEGTGPGTRRRHNQPD
ncbi:AMP-binding protein [Paenarthrobacter sp. Z7-10]|uniref:o-succinylbenzoate--CoA ligase n=1 Tax=Paenarthrobacter sp. Z7-10 TaxID=2787635 RepID=UPI0022A9215D|nr:o-succinylbenzoate--CoA ligase [Paenarthrobacter sp. Z7-10]MCZ2401761.1 AMP-binding protein [Paenarthrobacter sp. Z7-10]